MSFSLPQDTLTVLTHAPAEAVKLLADELIPDLGHVIVLIDRTGLVMLPYTDSANGTRFHLGEVLVAEARVRLESGVEGYAVCVGRDQLQSLAVALIDAALRADIQRDAILKFADRQREAQRMADETLLRQVEATRVEMETF